MEEGRAQTRGGQRKVMLLKAEAAAAKKLFWSSESGIRLDVIDPLSSNFFCLTSVTCRELPLALISKSNQRKQFRERRISAMRKSDRNTKSVVLGEEGPLVLS